MRIDARISVASRNKPQPASGAAVPGSAERPAVDPDGALIDLIYDAAADPLLWDSVLTGVADRLGSTSCILVGHQAGSWTEPRYGHFGRLEREINLRGSREDFGVSPFMPKLAALAVGEVANSDAFLPPAEARRTRWYREILTPQDIAHCVMTPLLRGQGMFGAFFVARSERRGAYGEEEVAALQRYIPHLRRAAGLRAKVDAYAMLGANRQQALDSVEIGVVLVDETGAAHPANPAAEEILSAGRGLALRGRKLAATDHAGGVRLAALIAATTAGGAGGTLALRRDLSTAPLLILVAPLGGAMRDRVAPPWQPRRQVALFIQDPARTRFTAESALADCFALTPGEGKIAGLLAIGHGVAGTARLLSLSENTIKMHAKRVFEKVGVTGQVELAHLYGRLAVPLRIAAADAA